MILYIRMCKELKLLNEAIRNIVSKSKLTRKDKAELKKLKSERSNVLEYITRKRCDQLKLNGNENKS